MTSTLVMADMSTIAPLVESDGVEVLAFYIGGDTPNVPQIAAVKALQTKYLLPIWTRSDPAAAEVSVEVDAQAAIKHLALIGAPRGTLVALDYETAIDAVYVSDFNAILQAAGYLVILYASEDDLDKNYKPSGGYWGADWTGEAHQEPGNVATQYASAEQANRPYDLSLIDVAAPLWDTEASGPVKVQADPYVVELQQKLNEHGFKLLMDGVKGPFTKGAFTQYLRGFGVLVEGNGDAPVQILQAMLNTWWSIIPGHLVVDGNFGLETLAAVEKFQVERNVKDSVINGKGDGQVGPNTKAALAV